MTFSLKSNFDFASRRTLLIAADRAILYQCRNGEVDVSYEFTADELGHEQFTRCLVETDPVPLYVLVDIVEEEYRQDVIPHVSGSDRSSVLERKFARLFRGTAYCNALTQGRETEGRKDDRVLLTAITKPEIISQWIELIQAQRIPIAGIYSLPVLSERLLKKIGAKGSNILLVSVNSASGLRQTFFRDRQIKISRLAPMPRIGTVPYAAHLLGELEKLRRYLNSLGLISGAGRLQIYILSHGAWLSELEQQCRDNDNEEFFLIDVAHVAARLGRRKKLTTAYSDAVFNQMLIDVAPKNHYATQEEMKDFSLHRMRNGLLAVSALFLMASIGLSVFNFLDGLSLKQQAVDARQKAGFYEERFQIARGDLPPTPVEPRDIKTAVDIVDTLYHYKSDPAPVLAVISAALESSPTVRLDRIEWHFAVDPNVIDPGDARRKDALEGDKIEIDPKYSHYHVAVFNAHLSGFLGDYRAAIAQTDELVAGLADYPDVKHVEVLAYPLDLTSEANLSGTATKPSDGAQARFVVKVVMGVGNVAEQS